MPVAPGTRFGDCEIVELLGSGGMGEVYRAHDSSLGRDVALKLLPGEFASDADRLRRFEQEARAAAALNHPNIVVVYRFGTTEHSGPYVVTELLQGQSLRDRLRQSAIPSRKTLDLGLQIARGLAAAHERGIIHRDLKPENIFLTREGVVKILDFGLAKLVMPAAPGAASTIATEAGIVLGTVGYMSPEQVRGQAVDSRSDLFSLGAILYEMVSGKRAFAGNTSADIISAILKDEPSELATTASSITPALARIIHRCLEKEPAERFQSARDLAFNLDLLTREESGSGRVPALARNKLATRVTPFVAALAMLAAAAGFFAARHVKTNSPAAAPVSLRRLTDFVGMEESPSLSPDGKAVAFTANVEEYRQVWVRLLAAGAPLQVTHDAADHQSPRWLPDSASLIYFSPSSEPNGQGQVWEIPALGGTPRPLVISLIPADVSHDGRHLAFLRANEGQLELAVADRDGSNPRMLSRLPTDAIYSNLRWSPNDRWLAFQSGRTFDYDVFYVSAEGGEPKRLTRDGNPEGGFAWRPDSSGVVYSSASGETVLYLSVMNLWSVGLDGQGARQLTFGETSYLAPDIDSRGNIVASRSLIQFDIWKFPVNGSPPENVRRAVQVTHQTGNVQTPSVAPNGRDLAYLSDSGGHGNVWVLNQETGQSRQLTFEQDPHIGLGVPVWSPDGTHIAYVTRGKRGWNVDLWVVNADGTDPHKVSEGGGWACWSADGQYLYYSPPADRGFRIEKVRPDGSNRVVVRNEGERAALGADGTLYFALGRANINGIPDAEIHAARPEDGQARFLTRIPGSRMLPGSRLASVAQMQPILSPDGQWLALALVDGTATNLWMLSTDSSEMRRITDFGHQATFIARRISWAPDGHFLYAAVGKGEADIVLFSNLVP